ncbi:sigma-70-like protein [Labedella gwakjiensis]|uniref:Sigma-70-like protein n=1 Tax=Labedella gwakjiensis TaxID=390269 RepID=A0A2P8GVT6_9MICO|nr:sigma factor [Labedella gwakjiensis]PSL38077.1 sigma-70-like protein [Labedella gwakjiensis]RUQ87365.1 hypothetical protein ELQ93_10755 [Labedella gwakjiensis]
MPDIPLEQLLTRIASGDRTAMAALYERVGGRMHAMMRTAIGHARGADECLLETFVDIWRRAGHYEPAAEPASRWITRIASRHIGRFRAATIDESAPAVAAATPLDIEPHPDRDVFGATA